MAASNKLYYLFLKTVSKISRTSEHSFLLESHEDFSEGSFRLFEHLKTDPENVIWWYISKDNIEKAKKLGVKHFIFSDGGFFYRYFIKPFKYFRIKYIIFSHRFPGFNYKKQEQVCLFLDHGQPFKYVPNFQAQIPFFAYRLTNNHFTGGLLSKNYDVPFDKMIYGLNPRVLPFVRNDQIAIKTALKLEKFNKVFVCLPTWNRTSYQKEELFVDFPILMDKGHFESLNTILAEKNICLIIKFHPMVKNRNIKDANFSNIQIIDNKTLLSKHYDVYDLLSCSDCLITDFSSVFIDYYLMSKPIIFLGGNYKYENTKKNCDGGFIFDNFIDYLGGPICYDYKSFVDEIFKIANNQDDYKEKRNNINSVYNCELTPDLCNDLIMRIKTIK